MDTELLCEALASPETDLYFSVREHFPQELIEAEVALLDSEYQKRFQEKESLWALRDDKRKKIRLDLNSDGNPEWFIVVGPGKLIYANRPRSPIIINGVDMGCDVLVRVDSYPEAVP